MTSEYQHQGPKKDKPESKEQSQDRTLVQSNSGDPQGANESRVKTQNVTKLATERAITSVVNCAGKTAVKCAVKCAIMQPTFLPWAGYFNLIQQADVFVFLDDVQFDRRSWQSRNRVFIGDKPGWLTCPTIKAPRETLIKDIQISDLDDWRSKHIKTLSLNYSKTPFVHQISPIINAAYKNDNHQLADMNIYIIKQICKLLGIKTKLIRASHLRVEGKRSEKLMNICLALGATDYLSPEGSRQYLKEDQIFDAGEVKLHFQQFHPKPYQQNHTAKFVSHLSIIDVIANIGIARTMSYIKESHLKETQIEESHIENNSDTTDIE